MPNIVSRQINYQNDIGRPDTIVRFKIKEQYADILDYVVPDNAPVCATSGLFKMRAAVALFPTGERIRFPIPDAGTAEIQSRIRQLLAAGAICVDLDGESWTQIAGSTVAIPAYTVPDGFSDKTGGIMTYTSDAAGVNQQVKVNYEIAPVQLSAVVADCVGTLVVAAACSTQLAGFKARRVIMTASNTVTNGSFVRQAPVVSLAEVPNCITAAQAVTPCVGYKGETVRNAHLYLPEEAPVVP